MAGTASRSRPGWSPSSPAGRKSPPRCSPTNASGAPKRDDRPARQKGARYPFSAQGWTRQWRKALADAGIEDFRFHDLRHTAATRVLRASRNLKAVQHLLGHTDIATTARYAHVVEDDVRNALLVTESRNSPEPAAADPAKTPDLSRKSA